MVFDKVREVIIDTLNCEEAEVLLSANLTEDLGADSLDAVELSMALEEAFGITIPDEAVAELKTVSDIVDYIEKNQ